MRTKLPKKWAVKITEENEGILREYHKNIPGVDLDYNFKGYLLSDLNWDRSGLYWGKEVNKIRYIEITFEEFKTLVLGEKQQPTEPQYEIY